MPKHRIDNILMRIDDEEKTLTEWAEIAKDWGVSRQVITYRLKQGWKPEDAVFVSPRKYGSKSGRLGGELMRDAVAEASKPFLEDPAHAVKLLGCENGVPEMVVGEVKEAAETSDANEAEVVQVPPITEHLSLLAASAAPEESTEPPAAEAAT